MHGKGAEYIMDENLKNSETNNGSAADEQNQTLPEAEELGTTEPSVVSEPELVESEATAAPAPAPEAIQPSDAVVTPAPVTQTEAPAIIQSSEVVPTPSPAKKHASKKARVIIAIILAVALLAAGAAAYLVTRSLHQPTDSDTKSSKVVKDTDDVPDTNVPTTSTPAVTYPKSSYHIKTWNYKAASIDTRIKLPAKVTKYKYYTVATLDDGSTLSKLLTDSTNADAPYETVYFVVTTSKVVFVNNLSTTDFDGKSYGVDTIEATIPEFNPTEAITYSGQTFSTFDTEGIEKGLGIYDSSDTITPLTTTEAGNKFYQVTSTVSGIKDYNVRVYDLATPDARTHRYLLDSAKISNDDGTLKVTWADSSNKTATFSNPVRGCSQGYANSDAVLTFSPDLSTAVKVGTVTATGKPVYRLTTASFVKGLYDEYASGRDNDKISLDEFKTKPTHVVFQDGLGKWILLQNSNYGPNGECGKPVIYLYPTKTTSVNVAVGANVTVSDPLYPAGGWKKVVAQTDGTLSYNGRSYDSLFWEGKGYGVYPDTSTVGSVVPQSKLLGTVRQQLAAQGLNAKETNDFMAFWSSRLPQTPYVKLTWLTTKQMNELAPLSISPMPQTAIRVFLDAEGLQKPVSLVPQSFSVPARQGFTVVEWGGLLR